MKPAGWKRLGLWLVLCCLPFLAVAAELAATVVFSTGQVSLLAGDGSRRAAARGDGLFAGESIETVAGRVQLRFRDGATLSLQPESHFRVDEYRFSGVGVADSTQDRGFFSLLKGGLRTVTGLLGKARYDQYRVRTAVAVIGIRGTDYQAVLDEGKLRLATTAGIVEICNDGGCLQVRAGESAVVLDTQQPPRLQPGMMPGPGVARSLLPQLPTPSLPAALPSAPLPVSQSPVPGYPTAYPGGANSPTGAQGPVR